MQALIVGGTGPTGPFIVEGLLQRDYNVTILHRGTHELEELPEVEHIHADPHFRETLDEALAGRTFDLVIATYGRLRHVAAALVGRTPRFIGVGGIAAYRAYSNPETSYPAGMRIPCPEHARIVEDGRESRFSFLVASTEDAVMEHHRRGRFKATIFRYPFVYGPHQPIPREWCVMRRILDKRPYIILPDGGLTISMRGYAANLAYAVLLAVDHPEVCAGQIYNCGDSQQLTLRQWVEVIANTMGYEIEIVSVPDAVAAPARPLMPLGGSVLHRLVHLAKIQRDLGYRDVVPVRKALAATVRWYLEHPPERGGDIEQRLQDPFNYEAEDRLVALYKKSLEQMQAIDFGEPPSFHAYPHPKTVGQLRDHRNR